MRTTDRWIARALVVFGLLDLAALIAVMIPREWMSAVGVWSGLSPLPADPIVGYLARTSSLLYGMHGAMLLFVSRDVPRYRPLIWFLSWVAVVQGGALCGIDWFEGMPLWWKTLEGSCLASTGLIVLGLLRAGSTSRPCHAEDRAAGSEDG